MILDATCLPGISYEPSPNHDERPAGVEPSLLVIHNISLPVRTFGTTYVTDLFCNRLDYSAHPSFESLRGVHVSAHFFVQRSGVVVQFVPTQKRAWHAGVSSFGGRERCNDFSIGIELEGSDFDPFTDLQYQSLIRLTYELARRHPLTDVVGHQHIAPTRKTDPGPQFDWSRYANEMQALLERVPTYVSLRFPSSV